MNPAKWIGLAGQLAAAGLCCLGLGVMGQAAVIPASAGAAQVLLEQTFTRHLAGHAAPSPWPGAGVVPVARISVARLGVREVVLAGGSDRALAYGPTVVGAHAPGGPSRVVVMAAHRDTHFRFMRNLVVGDVVRVETTSGAVSRYRVVRFETVRWDQFTVPTAPRHRLLALATCYPFAGPGHRTLRRIAWAQTIG